MKKTSELFNEIGEGLLNGMGDFISEMIASNDRSTIILFEAFLNSLTYAEKVEHLRTIFVKSHN